MNILQFTLDFLLHGFDIHFLADGVTRRRSDLARACCTKVRTLRLASNMGDITVGVA